ncbi:type II secretion system protein GspE [Rheinheimera sp. SA_1]|nr:type II secretion system protein GspE [Rheinheimera sp. SA_1]
MASLLEEQFGVSRAEVEKAKSYQLKYSGQLENILISMGSLSTEVLPELYAKLLDLPYLNDEDLADWVFPERCKALALGELYDRGWLPFSVESDQFCFATYAPFNKDAQEIITAHNIDFTIKIVNQDQFNLLRSKSELSDNFADSAALNSVEEARLRELAAEAPTVNLLNSLITRALRMRASDMHIEPNQGKAKVRFRIDGVLQDIDTVPTHLVLPVTTRLKILSSMDIAEKRRPQDGKIEMRIGGIDLDIRVSALPLNDGESVVMRFLRKDAINYDMKVLGISADIEQKILEDIKTTAGVVLLTGPTGSGKTTSLYTFLNRLNSPEVKIITLEDPVEYQLTGINQVQVQSDIGFDFAAGLRSIVRQDPDIIMLGEIRDKETASIAMQSALTGHLVFSTVHTNDAPSAYTRLLDLGVEEFLLNAALVSIVAQRLVRCLCPHCSVPAANTEEIVDKYRLANIATKFEISPVNVRTAVGCDLCNHTGYKGRLAMIEYLRCDDEIRHIPKDENFILKAREVNKNRGGRNLLEDGMLKVLQGSTTIEEVLRVAG